METYRLRGVAVLPYIPVFVRLRLHGSIIARMRKIVAIIGILTAVGIVCAQGPPKEGVAKSGSSVGTQTTAKSQNEQHPASNVTVVVNPPTAPASDEAEKEKAEDIAIQRKLAHFTRQLVIVGGLQTLVLAGTLVLIGIQANLMKVHAEHFEKLAGATELNARILLNSERPLMVMHTELMEGSQNSAVVATNQGRTPAMITTLSLHTVKIIPSTTSLPVPPVYDEATQIDAPIPVVTKGRPYIASLNEMQARDLCKTPDLWAKVQSGEYTLWVYGILYYEDLLNTPGKASHQTGWCCKYMTAWPSSSNRLVIAGPPGYNYYT